MSISTLTALLLTAVIPTALAKTDHEGCTSIEGTYTPTWSGPEPWRTRFYYVPDTFEVCSNLDCGGGRAPPKYSVPGCNFYTGTSTYSPMYLDIVTISGPTPTTEGVLRTGPPEGAVTSTSESGRTPGVTTAPTVSGSKDGGGTTETTVTSSTGRDDGEATTPTDAAAVPTVGALLGGCLVAGAAVMGML